MIETFTKLGEKIVVEGTTMTCTETLTKGCSGCDVLNMNTVCDDWLCSAKHRPDGKNTVLKAERWHVEGKVYVRTPYAGCDKCAFAARGGDEQPCVYCNTGQDMFKLFEE